MQNGNRLMGLLRGTRDTIEENEATADRLVDILRQAYLTAEIDSDGDLRVTMEDGVKLFVIILKRHPMLKFVAAFGLRKETEEIDRLRLLNTLNDKLIVARFAMPEYDSAGLVG
jgi:hypothetical protein